MSTFATTCPIALAIKAYINNQIFRNGDFFDQPKLTAANRKSMAAQHFTAQEPFVFEVARALIERPELFQDILARQSGVALKDRQERARAWRLLIGALSMYLSVARDAFLREQATANREARQVVEKMERDLYDRFYAGPRGLRVKRWDALRRATLMLDDVEKYKWEAWMKRMKEKKGPDWKPRRSRNAGGFVQAPHAHTWRINLIPAEEAAAAAAEAARRGAPGPDDPDGPGGPDDPGGPGPAAGADPAAPAEDAPAGTGGPGPVSADPAAPAEDAPAGTGDPGPVSADPAAPAEDAPAPAARPAGRRKPAARKDRSQQNVPLHPAGEAVENLETRKREPDASPSRIPTPGAPASS